MIDLGNYSKEDRIIMANMFYKWTTLNYEDEINACVKNTIRCQENGVLDLPEPRFKETDSYLVDLDTVSCIFEYQEPGHTIAVLNFASYKNPGGMFLNGSSAQEEALCHQSILYPVLLNFVEDYYAPHQKTLNRALYEDDALYTKGVRFFDYELKKEDGKFKWHKTDTTIADVITCAAPNVGTYCRYNGGSPISDECMNALCSRIITVLNTAVIGGCEDLVLGAFGCGVFKNDPVSVSDYFMDYIHKEYRSQFRKVFYAVPKGKSSKNYDAFKSMIKTYDVIEL